MPHAPEEGGSDGSTVTFWHLTMRKLILVVAGVLFGSLIGFFAGISFEQSKLQPSDVPKVEDLASAVAVSNISFQRGSDGVPVLVGIVENRSTQPLKDIEIRLGFYDEKQTRLAEAPVCCDNVGAGEKVEIKQPITGMIACGLGLRYMSPDISWIKRVKEMKTLGVKRQERAVESPSSK